MVQSFRWFVLLLVAILWACGGGDGGTGTDPGAADVSRDLAVLDVVPDLAGDPGADRLDPDLGVSDFGVDDPGSVDPGPSDPGVVDPGELDPGTPDPGPADVPALGTKTAGELCKDASECSMAMSCIAGQYTPAHCNIMCSTTEQCLAIAPGTSVTCQAMGGTGVCIWTCTGGKKCPGGLTCDGYFCG